MARHVLSLSSLLVPLLVACGGGDDGGGDDTDTNVDDGVNEAPSKPVVTLTPSDAVTGTPLAITYVSEDADGDALTYTVKWTVDADVGAFDKNADTIPGELVARDQTWTASVTASDGQAQSKVGKATIVIGNALPQMATFTWGPQAPTATDTLVVSGTGTDAEGDKVTVSYRWKVNGAVVAEGKNQASLPPGPFHKGDVVRVVLLLDDGVDDGVTEVESDPITIGNIAPTAPTVTLTPRVAHRRDTLSCTLTAPGEDLDGDTLTYTVTWLRDGAVVTTVPATLDTPVTQVANTGDVWTCLGRANDGTTDSLAAFATIDLGAEVPDIADMALGYGYSCAARADGHTACWGLDGPVDVTTGLVGTPTGRTHPPAVDFTAIAASDSWACGLAVEDGSIRCWGAAQNAANPPDGVFARLDVAGDYACAQGIDSTLTCWKRQNATTPVNLVPPAGGWRTFGVGATHGCAIDIDGEIACWGTPGSAMVDAPLGTYLTLTANGGHTCALGDDHTITCWGDDSAGQLQAPAGTFSSISAGWLNTCAVATDGSLDCWGDDSAGQSTPPAGTFVDVWAGAYHACARDADGVVVCWGDTAGGVLEIPWGKVEQIDMGSSHLCTVDGRGVARCMGADVSGETNVPYGTFADVDAATTHTCGRLTDGTAMCWGSNVYGETSVPAGGPWDDVAAGLDFSCGIHTGTQDLACWGNPGATVPIPGFGGSLRVVPQGRFTSVTAGGTFACALATDGTVKCWGQLPGGTQQTFLQISSGMNASCGVMADGNVKCWDGVPGFQMLNNKDGDFVSVSAGGSFACAVGRADGALTCWGGLTSLGQVPHPEGTGWSRVSVGDDTVCALDADERMACWGGWGRQPLDAGL